MVDDEHAPGGHDELAADDRSDQPAKIAVTLAAAHLIEAAVAAHLAPTHAALAARLGLSRSRLSNLIGLTALSPELQSAILELRVEDPLGRATERTVFELCAAAKLERPAVVVVPPSAPLRAEVACRGITGPAQVPLRPTRPPW